MEAGTVIYSISTDGSTVCTAALPNFVCSAIRREKKIDDRPSNSACTKFTFFGEKLMGMDGTK